MIESFEDTSWTARPSGSLMRKIMREEEESGRWLACIDGKHISIGDPAPDPDGNRVPRYFRLNGIVHRNP